MYDVDRSHYPFDFGLPSICCYRSFTSLRSFPIYEVSTLYFISGVPLTVFSFKNLACAFSSFSFKAGTPTECGNLDLTWQGMYGVHRFTLFSHLQLQVVFPQSGCI